MITFLNSAKKWIFLFLLVLTFCIFYYFDSYQYLTLSTLKTYQFTAEQWTHLHYKTAVLVYLASFTVLVACGIPCATVLTLLGGFLFGSIAVIYAVLGTTLGGAILFLAVRTSIGEQIAKSKSGWIKAMESGFQQNAFNYLLMLRLIPIFPCAIINVAAGALNISLNTYIGATVVGIFPASLVYAMIGRGLDKILAEQAPHLNIIFTPSIFFPLVGLAVLSLLPLIFKSIKKQTDVPTENHKEISM